MGRREPQLGAFGLTVEKEVDPNSNAVAVRRRVSNSWRRFHFEPVHLAKGHRVVAFPLVSTRGGLAPTGCLFLSTYQLT